MKRNKSSLSNATTYREIGEFWDDHSLFGTITAWLIIGTKPRMLLFKSIFSLRSFIILLHTACPKKSGRKQNGKG